MEHEERLPITGLLQGAVPPAVIVCGDPARAEKTARYLKNVEVLGKQREYHVYRGMFRFESQQDVPVAVASHGVGAPGAAIAFEELIAAGARRLIRVGTCGGLQPEIADGDLVVATGAVDSTGYGRVTVPAGYPAVADPILTGALLRATNGRDHPYHSGIVLTVDGFYKGVATPQAPDYQALSQARVVAVEMECAALFIVASLRGVQSAAILAVDGNVLEEAESMDSYDPHRQVVRDAVAAEIEIALQALAVDGRA
jgi:uridine phosphorylase